ncbi:MAG: hypothetical protein S0880_11365 [Actinomycetota bacterium]|nr:hypothetical protein [Actinomycetota bacterium]
MDETSTTTLLDPRLVATGVERLTWPKARWDHRAHLAAGAWWVHRLGPGALGHARRSIRRYNEATGGENTADAGYHETITAYYLAALAAVIGETEPTADRLGDLGDHELLGPRAPLRFWSAELLMSRAARASWIDPDVEPLPAELRRSVAPTGGGADVVA